MSDIASMTAEEQLAKLEEAGMETANNSWIASRFPPGATIGINPMEFYTIYKNGDLFSELNAQLPEPLARPTAEFTKAAASPDLNDPILNPDLKM